MALRIPHVSSCAELTAGPDLPIERVPDFSRFRPVEYNPEPINTPGPSRTSKVFPRYKLIEQSELFNTIMATQRFDLDPSQKP